MIRKEQHALLAALLTLFLGPSSLQATSSNEQIAPEVESITPKTDTISNRGKAWLVLRSVQGDRVLYANDIRGYWDSARQQVPDIFDIDTLTLEQKFEIMLYVLGIMSYLPFQEKPGDYSYNYKTALTLINDQDILIEPNSFVGPGGYQTQLSVARSAELKKTLLSQHYHYTLKRIIVKDQARAQDITTRINQALPAEKMQVLQDLAKQYSLSTTIDVAEVSLTNMPAYYHKPLKDLAVQTACICEDKIVSQYHVVYLEAKTAIPFSYDEIEILEYTVPCVFYPPTHRLTVQSGQQEPLENQLANSRIKQEMLALIMQPNFDPLKDRTRHWIKRKVNILYCDDISLPISTGAHLWKVLDPQRTSTINSQIFGDPVSLPYTRRPYFFKMYPYNFRQEKTFIKECLEFKRNDVQCFSIIFINKVTRVVDNPDFVRDFVLKTLLVEDTHVITQVMATIRKVVSYRTMFCVDKDEIFKALI